MLEQQESLEAIAKQRKISVGTVIQHLEQAIEQGETLNTSHLVFSSDKRFALIANAFAEIGDDFLAPVKNYLGEAYSYDELRFARFLLKTRAGK